MRTICEVIKGVLDYTENESVATVQQVEALTDELCKALRAEGHETHSSRDVTTLTLDGRNDPHT